jgi:hypothetical protein
MASHAYEKRGRYHLDVSYINYYYFYFFCSVPDLMTLFANKLPSSNTSTANMGLPELDSDVIVVSDEESRLDRLEYALEKLIGITTDILEELPHSRLNERRKAQLRHIAHSMQQPTFTKKICECQPNSLCDVRCLCARFGRYCTSSCGCDPSTCLRRATAIGQHST